MTLALPVRRPVGPEAGTTRHSPLDPVKRIFVPRQALAELAAHKIELLSRQCHPGRSHFTLTEITNDQTVGEFSRGADESVNALCGLNRNEKKRPHFRAKAGSFLCVNARIGSETRTPIATSGPSLNSRNTNAMLWTIATEVNCPTRRSNSPTRADSC